MSRFKKKGKKGLPAISTASLPDIVFMLLFFFMVTTVVKESDPKVRFTIPTTKYTKLIEDRSSIGFIYAGTPKAEGEGGTKFEMNGKLVTSTNALSELVKDKYGDLTDEEKAKYYFALKIDKETKMYEVKKIKKALIDQDARKIIYSTEEDE